MLTLLGHVLRIGCWIDAPPTSMTATADTSISTPELLFALILYPCCIVLLLCFRQCTDTNCLSGALQCLRWIPSPSADQAEYVVVTVVIIVAI